jgi:hypothetical protein
MEATTHEQPKKRKSRAKKVVDNMIEIAGRMYKILRTGQFVRTSPKDSRRAKHKRYVAVIADFNNQRPKASLMRRLRSNLDDYLRAEARLSKRRNGRVTTHPKERRAMRRNNGRKKNALA